MNISINDVILQNKARKRGRPRKNSLIQTKIKNNVEKRTEKIEEDIILHFPISTKEINEKNVIGSEIIETECMSDHSETSKSSSEETIDNRQYQHLIGLLKEKDKKIEELEKEVFSSKQQVSEGTLTVSKNVRLYHIDVPFDKNNDDIIIPEFTNKSCLWDTCQINGMPVFLPDKYYDNKFYVVGWFCSLNCAIAYNLMLDDCKVSERYSLLKWLYGKTNENIEPSPSFKVLDKYGGKMTIEEYRKKISQSDKEYRIITAPLTFVCQTLEERINRPARSKLTSQPRNLIIDAMKCKK